MNKVVGFARYILGSVLMFGVSPEYFGMWLIWRALTIFMPSWIYQWGDDKLYSLYQRLVLFFFETCSGIEVYLYGDAEEILKRRETILYLSNHQSTVDWIVANMVAVRGGSLGHLRYVMKDSLQMIPLYGYYFYAHGCIYVKRGQFSQGKMIDSLNYLKDKNIPTWLIIFPEGTRYHPGTPKVIERSEQYAQENNLVVLKRHLVPKVRGTWLAVEHLHEKIEAVYNISVYYEGTTTNDGVRQNCPQLKEFLMGKCPKVHISISRISMNEIPKTEEKLKIWLHELFVKKDLDIEPFFKLDADKTADIAKSLHGKRSPLSIWSTFSSFLFFGIISLPFALMPMGRKMYLQLLVYCTLGSYGWLAVRSVC